MTFGFTSRSRSLWSLSPFQPWRGQPSALDICQIRDGHAQLICKLEQHSKARVSFTSFDLLKIPKGDAGNVLLGSAGNVPRLPDVFANQLPKRGKVHAPRFPVD